MTTEVYPIRFRIHKQMVLEALCSVFHFGTCTMNLLANKQLLSQLGLDS